MPEVVDEADGGCLLERVVDVVNVNLALVEQVVEDVDRLDGRRTLLLVAEDEVDPFVEVGRHVITLQRLQPQDNTQVNVYPLKPHFAASGCDSHLSVDSDELPRVALGPRRQNDVTQLGAILFGP